MKEISRRGRRRSRDEKGNQGVGHFRFINILQIFSANYLLISSITFTLSFFFPCFFYPDIYPHPHRTHPRPRTSIHFPRQLHRVSVAVEKKISDFKKTFDWQGSPQTLIENLLSCMKFTDRECAKHNNKEDKRNSVFRDTVPALSVYFKGRFNEKMESYTILLRQIF